MSLLNWQEIELIENLQKENKELKDQLAGYINEQGELELWADSKLGERVIKPLREENKELKKALNFIETKLNLYKCGDPEKITTIEKKEQIRKIMQIKNKIKQVLNKETPEA